MGSPPGHKEVTDTGAESSHTLTAASWAVGALGTRDAAPAQAHSCQEGPICCRPYLLSVCSPHPPVSPSGTPRLIDKCNFEVRHSPANNLFLRTMQS